MNEGGACASLTYIASEKVAEGAHVTFMAVVGQRVNRSKHSYLYFSSRLTFPKHLLAAYANHRTTTILVMALLAVLKR